MYSWMVFIFALLSEVATHNHGPVFLLEPPTHLTFSNTTGSQVSCSAHGSPTPQVEWLLQDGQTVTAVPGLRQSLGNGTLYFPPFRAQDYRKDVHSTIYRCRASNLAGTILSRHVSVRAVVNQHYEIQVYHTHVSVGNTAVFVCVIPAFVKEHVSVTSWSRDESILLPGSNMGGRMIVTYGTGELHIRSARAEDGLARYSCLTLHVLTQDRKRSPPAILTVTEPTRTVAPRLAPTVQTVISADRESDIHLTCSAQGNPPPTFSWFREIGGYLQPVLSLARYEPSQDILRIQRLKSDDSGRWTCKVSNHFGEQRLDIHLTVTAHLSVHILPQLQVVNSGESAIFNCSVSGSPIGQTRWFRNGEPLVTEGNNKIKLLSPLVLSLGTVTRHDRGMYQCFAQNDRESAQGSAELRLGDTVPELQYTFIEQAMKPGPQISLRCSAVGSPPPQFRWFLDGEPLTEFSVGHRYAISQYVNQAGDVISHLNISNVRVEDGGLYTCQALNSLGSTKHSARLNIYGSPFIRSIGPIKAVAGEDITIHCPYSGYPIGSVRWERYGQELPLDLRHRIEEKGSLTISRLDPSADSGFYACIVTNRNGEVSRREIKLIIHSPPILEPFSFPASLQEGGRAQVTCYITSGDMPIHFAWYKDGESISATLQVEERAAEFYSMLIFKEVTSRHSGAYTCVASNSAAKANYTAELKVKVAPYWISEPQNVSIVLGSSILIECSAKGFPKPQITWLKGQGKISTEYQPLVTLHSRANLLENGSIYLETVNSQDEGHYLCRATNDIGAGLAKVIYVSVNEPVRFDLPGKNVSIKRGNNAILLCHIYGDLPIEVSWTLNETRVDISNNYRYITSKTKAENELKSQVTIRHADRQDSGMYKCLAENVYGRSEHIINLIVQEKPDPPNMLQVVEVGSRSVRLSWKKPFDGNSPIIGYLLQYQNVGVNQDWEQSTALNLTLPANTQANFENTLEQTATVNNLSPATVYTMRMLAVNSIDQSAFTEIIIAKTQEEEPSEAPKDVRIESIGPGELFLVWNIPPRESWNGELLGYIISWSEHDDSANHTKIVTVKGWATTKFQLTGLKKFTRYNINIRAFNSISSGPASPTIVGITKEGVPEAPPQNIICSHISSQSMKISWGSPPLHFHGGLIQGYKIFYRPIPSNENVDILTTGEVKRTTSIETYLHGLYKFTNYSIKVLAYTGAGDGAISSPLFCSTEEDLPGPPANIKAAALTGESILISWLPPNKPNGRIIHYTVYNREAGRSGKHISYNVRIEDLIHNEGLMYEIRNLLEHQLYEFWVTATTSIGEGETSPIIAQATNSRAPSRIASFSLTIYKPINSEVLFPCLAVGNPTPRTRWIYRDRPITFSSFYKITAEGFLFIHRTDQSLAGNYTCSAKNLFGEDDITYTLAVLLPPSAPTLEVQYVTTKSIKLHWSTPEDGGTSIQGYILSTKFDTNDWTNIELSPEHTVYSLDGLHCGSIYHLYISAYNRVGSGSPSSILTINTKGSPPSLPKEKDFIVTNSTSIQLNLYNWPDGGCPMIQFSILYKPLGQETWSLISNSVSEEKIFIQNLLPSTWYQLKITAKNDAGQIISVFTCATTNIRGEQIPVPPNLSEDILSSDEFVYKDVYVIVPTVGSIVLFLCSIVLWYVMNKRGRNVDNDETEIEKTGEKDDARNCQQLYTSSPVKATDKSQTNPSGMYEISPYATFNVCGNNSRSVTTSTLDYTMQFKTFGHIEDDERNAIIYSKSANNKHNWHKHRQYNSEGGGQSKSRMRSIRIPTRGDSESDDTSGSPCGECPGGSNYRIPVKSTRDLFHPGSSTESNEVSPITERKHTPRHVGIPKRQHQPTSSSSTEEECSNVNCSSEHTPIQLQPPNGFSDSIELSEAECDRDLISNKLYSDLSTLLAKYQERKEQEKKEFTIHV